MVEKTNSQIAWQRWSARFIDFLLAQIILSFPVGFVLYLINITNISSKFTYPIVLSFIWLIVESIFLSLFGGTPGKWLFKIKIIKSDGSKPNFSIFLRRSLIVLGKGLALTIPFITFILQILTYQDIKKNGNTSWDRDLNLIVLCGDVSGERNLLGMVIAIFLIGIILYLRILGGS